MSSSIMLSCRGFIPARVSEMPPLPSLSCRRSFIHLRLGGRASCMVAVICTTCILIDQCIRCDRQTLSCSVAPLLLTDTQLGNEPCFCIDTHVPEACHSCFAVSWLGDMGGVSIQKQSSIPSWLSLSRSGATIRDRVCAFGSRKGRREWLRYYDSGVAPFALQIDSASLKYLHPAIFTRAGKNASTVRRQLLWKHSSVSPSSALGSEGFIKVL